MRVLVPRWLVALGAALLWVVVSVALSAVFTAGVVVVEASAGVAVPVAAVFSIASAAA